jgi:hypothetical protein
MGTRAGCSVSGFDNLIIVESFWVALSFSDIRGRATVSASASDCTA